MKASLAAASLLVLMAGPETHVTTQKDDYRRLPAGARIAGLALGSEASQHDIRKRP
jgi:hypothetical protein